MITPKEPTISLSICIPIYNFGQFVGETLYSILTQDGASNLEIIVVDGASTDNTEEFLHTLSSQFPQITYIRLPKRGGIDRDMAEAVSHASGDYCWLFSGDDVMAEGAIRRVFHELTQGHDVYICKHFECSFTLEPITEWPVLRTREPTVFDLGNPTVRERYFSMAENTEAFFSFMGGIIVKRSIWNSVPLNESFLGTCWAHVARFFEIIQTGLVVKYLPEPLVYRRGGNDSFSDRGIVNRLDLAVTGFNRLADVFFGHHSIEGFHIRRTLRRELNLGFLIGAKSNCRENAELEDREKLDAIARVLYSDVPILGAVPYLVYLLFPDNPLVVNLTRKIYRLALGRDPY